MLAAGRVILSGTKVKQKHNPSHERSHGDFHILVSRSASQLLPFMKLLTTHQSPQTKLFQTSICDGFGNSSVSEQQQFDPRFLRNMWNVKSGKISEEINFQICPSPFLSCALNCKKNVKGLVWLYSKTITGRHKVIQPTVHASTHPVIYALMGLCWGGIHLR